MDVYMPGRVGICAGSLMLKWNMLNLCLQNSPMNPKPGENINIYINLEGVLQNLFLQKGINRLVADHKQKVVLELESSILNLMAHYRSYFKSLKCNPIMYFYITSLDKNYQEMQSYNKFYREYYYNKYRSDPIFSRVGDLLNDTVIPELKLILTYIKDCYLIESKGFDSSIIPRIISSLYTNKDIIISSDLFDTLYIFDPVFLTIYIKRRYSNLSIASNVGEAVASILKNVDVFDLDIFSTELYYRLLLTIHGSKIRNIKSSKGLGYGKLIKILKTNINSGNIVTSYSSLDSIIDSFPHKHREELKDAFQCMSIENQFELITDNDINYVKSQIVNKVDERSINSLNNKRFLEFPINIEGLIK